MANTIHPTTAIAASGDADHLAQWLRLARWAFVLGTALGGFYAGKSVTNEKDRATAQATVAGAEQAARAMTKVVRDELRPLRKELAKVHGQVDGLDAQISRISSRIRILEDDSDLALHKPRASR